MRSLNFLVKIANGLVVVYEEQSSILQRKADLMMTVGEKKLKSRKGRVGIVTIGRLLLLSSKLTVSDCV